ncbi:MAG: UvrB/UvrC motif-containing protein [Verrucomicrobiota bacterium]
MSEKRPDKCSHCKKPASIFLTQVIDGKVAKVAFCDSCPEGKEAQQSLDVNIVGKASPKYELPKPSLNLSSGSKCPHCGFGQDDFKELGRMGCSRCYDVFADKLSPILGKIHEGTQHKGKVPGREPEEMAITVSPQEISDLKNRLQEHVQKEEYEKAAEVRDRIKELEGLL